jgi:hypothetical protein
MSGCNIPSICDGFSSDDCCPYPSVNNDINKDVNNTKQSRHNICYTGLVIPNNNEKNMLVSFFSLPQNNKLLKDSVAKKIMDKNYHLLNNEEFFHTRAVFQNNSIWPPNSNIKVTFVLDDSECGITIDTDGWEDWVQTVIEQNLAPLVDINWTWGVSPSDANLTITYKPCSGSFTSGVGYLGSVDTMHNIQFGNLDWNKEHDCALGTCPPCSTNTGAVVMHEFGHLMGMVHEQHSPDRPFTFNNQAAQKYFGGPPNNWTDQQIYNQVLAKYNWSQYNGSSYDPKSIMQYLIPCDIFIKGPALNCNVGYSKLDKYWLRKKYKYRGKEVDPDTSPETPSYVLCSGLKIDPKPSGDFGTENKTIKTFLSNNYIYLIIIAVILIVIIIIVKII